MHTRTTLPETTHKAILTTLSKQEGKYIMKTDKEVLEEIRRLVEAVVNHDPSIFGIPCDNHIEACERILSILNRSN